MDDVQFQNEQINRSRFLKKEKGMTAFLIEKGLAKDKKQASTILLVLAMLVFVVALFVITRDNKKQPVQEVPILPQETLGT